MRRNEAGNMQELRNRRCAHIHSSYTASTGGGACGCQQSRSDFAAAMRREYEEHSNQGVIEFGREAECADGLIA